MGTYALPAPRPSKSVPIGWSPDDGLSEIGDPFQPVCDLGCVQHISVPDPLLEPVQTGLFSDDHLTTLFPMVGIERTNEASMGIRRSIQTQGASDG